MGFIKLVVAAAIGSLVSYFVVGSFVDGKINVFPNEKAGMKESPALEDRKKAE